MQVHLLIVWHSTHTFLNIYYSRTFGIIQDSVFGYAKCKVGVGMITFEPLWETLKRKNISQYTLIKEYGVSTGTLDALRKNRSITMNTLNDLCNMLSCDISDIIRFIPDQK